MGTNVLDVVRTSLGLHYETFFCLLNVLYRKDVFNTCDVHRAGRRLTQWGRGQIESSGCLKDVFRTSMSILLTPCALLVLQRRQLDRQKRPNMDIVWTTHGQLCSHAPKKKLVRSTS